ncbi:MAG: hypothetical protein IT567_05010 [Alphaproteobacteria bacterium]|nr:hypothetical protein [Alphaproteobacteria bacterium]
MLPKTPKVALCFESTAGRGHLELAEMNFSALAHKGASIAFLTGTLSHFMPNRDIRAAQVFSIPSIHKGLRGIETEDGTVYLRDPEFQKKRADALAAAIREYVPDVVVIEPRYMHESAAIVAAAREVNPKVRIYGIMLDIFDPYRAEGASYEQKLTALNLFDEILIMGDGKIRAGDICDVMQTPELRNKTRYLNYYSNVMPPRESIPDSDREVVVSAGGGYAYWRDRDFYEAAIQSRKHSEAFKDNVWRVFVADPEALEDIRQLARAEDPTGEKIVVELNASGDRFRKTTANAAAVIQRGGYNLIAEALNVKDLPVVVVPLDSAETSLNEQMVRPHMLREHLPIRCVQVPPRNSHDVPPDPAAISQWSQEIGGQLDSAAKQVPHIEHPLVFGGQQNFAALVVGKHRENVVARYRPTLHAVTAGGPSL